MGDKDEQKKMTFDYVYEIEEMGRLLGPQDLYIFEDFAKNQLGLHGHDFDRVGDVKAVMCPFCLIGKLQITEVKTRYSGGLGSYHKVLHHVGNSYVLRCTNVERCKGSFYANLTWMYID